MEKSNTQKKVNYTASQEATLKKMYVEDNIRDLKVIAQAVGKPEKSVLQKLVKMGVYEKKKPVAKNGQPVIHKSELSTALADFIGLSEPDTQSLEKANKGALQKIVAGYEKLTRKMADLLELSDEEMKQFFEDNQGAILDTLITLEPVGMEDSEDSAIMEQAAIMQDGSAEGQPV